MIFSLWRESVEMWKVKHAEAPFSIPRLVIEQPVHGNASLPW